MNADCYFWIAGFMTGWFFGVFVFGFVGTWLKDRKNK